MYDRTGWLRYTRSLLESAFVEAIVGGSLKTRPRVRTRESNGCLTSNVVSIIIFGTWEGDWNCDRVSFARFDGSYLDNYLVNVKKKNES